MNLADKTVIYIPHLYTHYLEVQQAITAITRGCGGATHELVRGSWVCVDGTLKHEHITRITWWHKNPEPSLINLIKIARYLIEELGEEAVMVEYQRAETGNTVRFLTAADVQESSDE